MDLRIENIAFSHFRNYDTFSLDAVGDLTIFIGRNGVGKTNILEGINLLTSGDSFRHAQISQLLKEGSDHARVEMGASDGNRQLDISLDMEPGKKKYQVNGKVKALADYKGTLPAVSFTPDDLELAKKSSTVKRDAIDSLGMQLSKNYYVVHRDYEKTIRYKNRLLKEEASRPLVESINDTLVLCASQLFCYRVALFNRLIPVVGGYYNDISNTDERFRAHYIPSWGSDEMGEGAPSRDDVKEWLYSELSRRMDEERARGRSLVGPHADKIVFTLSNRDASGFASQGQQRSIVLSWKLAEVRVVKQSLGTSPVLLLDDVMSELDAQRRDKLITFVNDDIQTFITATDLSNFNDELVEKAQVIQL